VPRPFSMIVKGFQSAETENPSRSSRCPPDAGQVRLPGQAGHPPLCSSRPCGTLPGRLGRLSHSLNFTVNLTEPGTVRRARRGRGARYAVAAPVARGDPWLPARCHRVARPRFTNARSVHNALERARLRRRNRLIAADGTLGKDDLDAPGACRLPGQPRLQHLKAGGARDDVLAGGDFHADDGDNGPPPQPAWWWRDPASETLDPCNRDTHAAGVELVTPQPRPGRWL